MKIIKKEEIPTEQISCSNCRSILEYDNSDLSEDWDRENYNGHFTGIRFYHLRCPVCGVYISANWIRK